MRRLFCLLLFSLAVALPCRAQVVDTERGKVEFVGLDEWTAQGLAEKIRSLAPDRSLHACAVVLKDELGFAEASVQHRPMANGEGRYTVVSVVEPSEADRVQYLESPSDSADTVGEWKKGIRVLAQDLPQFSIALQYYGGVLAGNRERIWEKLSTYRKQTGVEPDSVAALWDFLQAQDSKASKRLALRTLRNDGNAKNRMVATAILANFSSDDETWHQLVRSLRDADSFVRFMASMALRTMSGQVGGNGPTKLRTVNWAPAATSIRHVLNGTNLSSHPTVLEALARTGIGREVGKQVITEDSADLLLAYLNSEEEKARRAAQNFLVQASGKDYESSSEWKKWFKQSGFR